MDKETCEVCGKREAKFLVLIEGAKLSACPPCAYSGKIIAKIGEDESSRTEDFERGYSVPKRFREEEAPVEGYGRKIRNARENQGWKVEELGKMINEKASYLEHIEKEKTLPPLPVLKKLEKKLGITLIEKVSPSNVAKSQIQNSKKKDFTLLDALESGE
ncbi:TIGR00270 family protein [Candidatus Micrarchaeota archaeon]|nr:TIGR00270 family protein [Candidatus Micrarchaeota archaeon]